MTTNELRTTFLEFFSKRGHQVVPSAPLVPDDATLLFVNAGMVPFKDTFLGLETRPYSRATTSQKCLRVSGKHNDLETVGPSPWHHTFFEMLGNFSFGDYFKREAIEYAWTFLTKELGAAPDRLITTVHRDDAEAYRLWTEDMGRSPDYVLQMGDKTNFWMMADIGPCGPTSELHYDFGPEHCTCGRADCSVALDNGCERWLEIWNLVFMQYEQAADGARRPLAKPGVDTGMGLERISTVVQGVHATYDTDVLAGLIGYVMGRARPESVPGSAGSGKPVDGAAGHPVPDKLTVGCRVLADHSRSMTFLIADGVLPGNEGRNYVLRLIMRRAMRFARQIGMESPFLADLCAEVIRLMAPAYPYLTERADWISQVVSAEEERFERTLASGLAVLDDVIERLATVGAKVIPGDEVFRLYDTFGFPPDLTRVVAEERGLTVDRQGFDLEMAAQKARGRAVGTFKSGDREALYRRMDLAATRFMGYDATSGEGAVLALVTADGPVDEVGGPNAEADQAVEVALDATPFYAESGGQVGDTGWLLGASGRVRVVDTRRLAGITVHFGELVSGAIRVGETLTAEVDGERRLDIMRNHTATHLLHRALQETLGSHAQQRGSLVAPDRLRFDFAHLKGLSADELRTVERKVNDMVREDAPVKWHQLPIDEAKKLGAMMLFGEKYGDVVRLVEVDGLSRELCGGTHLARTGQIGSFVITTEGSVGSGLRRIEALTGRGAEAFVRARLDQLSDLAARVGAQTVDALPAKVGELSGRIRELQRELEQARAAVAGAAASDLMGQAQQIEGVTVLAVGVEASDAAALRDKVDALRRELGSGVIVVGALVEGAPRVVASVSDDLVAKKVHAGELVKALAAVLGGGGGGRPMLAEAGGRLADKLPDALAEVPALVKAQLAR